jgi:hypothetical protein
VRFGFQPAKVGGGIKPGVKAQPQPQVRRQQVFIQPTQWATDLERLPLSFLPITSSVAPRRTRMHAAIRGLKPLAEVSHRAATKSCCYETAEGSSCGVVSFACKRIGCFFQYVSERHTHSIGP